MTYLPTDTQFSLDRSLQIDLSVAARILLESYDLWN